MKFQPKIIELFGLPRTGKSTTILGVEKHLINCGYKVHVVKERAAVCPIEDKLDPKFNFWTLISFLKEYLEASENEADFVLADRGVFDAYVWVNLLAKENRENVISDFLNLANLDFILPNFLQTFYLYSEVNVVLQREAESNLEWHPHRIMNSDMLNEYIVSFLEIEPSLKEWCGIQKIDTTQLTIEDTTKIVCKQLDKLMKNKEYRNNDFIELKD